MINRNELEEQLKKEFFKIIISKETTKEICDYTKEKYEIPRAMMSDYITMRIELTQATDFILFCLLDAVNTNNNNSIGIETYYSKQEIKKYKSSKFEVDKIKFPIKFKVIQVTDNQWIGKIDVNMLMKLREAQLINYNINAQRTMTKIIKGDQEFYKITVNQTAVESIAELMNKGIYIPTPFTLNIPEDEEANYYYDEDKSELVIKSLDCFHITDGYHRYLACCRNKDINSNFNYQMELRIVSFSEDKARQFIYQQDQKTKLKKIDSNSYNVNKASNIVVNRLNENSQCNLQGEISRNEGLINFGELSGLIDYFYFKDTSKHDNEKKLIIATTKELIENFNLLTEHKELYLNQVYSYKELAIIMCVFNYYKENGYSKKSMCRVIDKSLARMDELDNKKFYAKTPKKTMMSDIENLIKEVK